jgi:hypothetical protein
MTIQDEIWLLAHSKEPEDRREWAVLYFKSQGLTHRQVGEKLGYGKDWVQRYMTSAYRRFGAPKDVDRDEKFEWLEKNVFPALREFIAGNPDTLKELPAPPEGEPPEEPKSIKLVPPPGPIIIDGRINRPPRPYGWIALGIILLVAVGYLAYQLGRNQSQPAPTSTPISLSSPSPLPQPSATVIAPPTQAPSDTPAPPTDTSIPSTETIPPPTPAFYNQGEWAPLKDGVFVRLKENFDSNGGACMPPQPGFTVGLEINNTTGSQFVLRYDSSGFHAQDDLGNNYTLEGVGTSSCIDPPGVQQFIASYNFSLFIKFAGQSPINAKYLIITADSLSGVKVVFHKLY